jgi:hypothetical protein
MDGADTTALIIFIIISYMCGACCCVVVGPCRICKVLFSPEGIWPEESLFLNCVASTTLGPMTCHVVTELADVIIECE